MKVKELIKELESANPEADVILQKDGEGNGYSPLSAVDVDAIYVADSTWSGQAYSPEWTAEDVLMVDEQWEKLKSLPRCVVLAPVN